MRDVLSGETTQRPYYDRRFNRTLANNIKRSNLARHKLCH
ncbi:hypothetical protein JCM19235_4231 [Vibrio maritimus]|uniref:Uncharacterized protein n=1 Tax=Vibrio maritimus TaxID=990268 RepID=A0A090RXP7_9VIBR|nr:hypothetical protein JCM19235_4231 [Vibrio maritimus]